MLASPTTTNSYCVQVTDHSTTAVSANSAVDTLTVNTPTLTLTESNSILETGQWTTFTVKALNNIGTTTVQLYNVSHSAIQGGLSNVLIFGSGGSNTFSILSGATGTFNFNAVATDTGSSSGNFAFNSITNTITVNAVLSGAL